MFYGVVFRSITGSIGIGLLVSVCLADYSGSRLFLHEKVKRADVMVVGRVSDVRPKPRMIDERPFEELSREEQSQRLRHESIATITVEKTLKGRLSDGPLELTYIPGGTIKYRPVKFVKASRYILLLVHDEGKSQLRLLFEGEGVIPATDETLTNLAIMATRLVALNILESREDRVYMASAMMKSPLEDSRREAIFFLRSSGNKDLQGLVSDDAIKLLDDNSDKVRVNAIHLVESIMQKRAMKTNQLRAAEAKLKTLAGDKEGSVSTDVKKLARTVLERLRKTKILKEAAAKKTEGTQDKQQRDRSGASR